MTTITCFPAASSDSAMFSLLRTDLPTEMGFKWITWSSVSEESTRASEDR